MHIKGSIERRRSIMDEHFQHSRSPLLNQQLAVDATLHTGAFGSWVGSECDGPTGKRERFCIWHLCGQDLLACQKAHEIGFCGMNTLVDLAGRQITATIGCSRAQNAFRRLSKYNVLSEVT